MTTERQKVALVTGASRGIGRAIAERLAREGALVAVHYATNADAADEVASAIGGFAVGQPFGEPGDVDALFARARRGAAAAHRLHPPRHRRQQRRHRACTAGPRGRPTPELATTPQMAVNARAPLFVAAGRRRPA